MALRTERLFLQCFQIELEFKSVGFCGRKGRSKEEKAKKFKILIALFFPFWFSVNSIYTYQKIPVKSIKIFVQREEKEDVKCQQEYKSSEYSHKEEGKMRWTVKRSIKLTKYEGHQQEYLQNENQ